MGSDEALKSCPNCAATNARLARFCTSCGQMLEQTHTALGSGTGQTILETAAIAPAKATCCNKCGAANVPPGKFCRACGQALRALSASTFSPTISKQSTETALQAETPAGDAQERPLVEAQKAQRGPSTVNGPPLAPLSPPAAAKRVDAKRAAEEKQISSRRNLVMPVAAFAGVLLLAVGGWFVYSFITHTKAPSQVATAPSESSPASAPPQANVPRKTGSSSSPQTVAPALSQAASAPTSSQAQGLAMARDSTSGCQVWKPELVPNESVNWSGACKDGFAEGPGIAEWSRDGQFTLRYEGSFRAGLLQGTGTMVSAGGDRYSGGYRDGKRDGKGSYSTVVGDAYSGEWRDNKREGMGVLVLADGRRFEGEFRDGKPTGTLGPPTPLHAGPPSANPQNATGRPTSERSSVSTPPTAKSSVPAARREARPEERKARNAAAPPPDLTPSPASPPPVPIASGESAPKARPAPSPAIAQAVPNDPCGGLSGLKAEQCRACRDDDKWRRFLCEEKVRFTYCLNKGAGTADCPQAQPKQDGGA